MLFILLSIIALSLCCPFHPIVGKSNIIEYSSFRNTTNTYKIILNTGTNESQCVNPTELTYSFNVSNIDNNISYVTFKTEQGYIFLEKYCIKSCRGVFHLLTGLRILIE